MGDLLPLPGIERLFLIRPARGIISMLNVLGLFGVPLNRRLVSKYGDFTGGKAVGCVKVNTEHLVPTLRMSGSIFPFLRVFTGRIETTVLVL